ncbi:MAG: hypothetical protein E7019_02680 [Alphaproteobacteria bacterium]|nr:hypothetical protein [Alphaproteobacteria bacterium]
MENDAVDIFSDLLNELFETKFNNSSRIIQLEKETYNYLGKYNGNIYGLITLMFAQFMQGKKETAKSTANTIWEIGGELTPEFESIYIEILLGLGLLDKVAIMIKPKFENLKKYIDDFYPVLSKFAVMTGSTILIEKLSMFEIDDDRDKMLFDFISIFKETECSSQFKDLQKLVLENIADKMCAYEYELYNDRGLSELEVVVYTTLDGEACAQKERDINKKIDAYWISCGKDRLYNYSVSIRNIQQYGSWISSE